MLRAVATRQPHRYKTKLLQSCSAFARACFTRNGRWGPAIAPLPDRHTGNPPGQGKFRQNRMPEIVAAKPGITDDQICSFLLG